jgi:L-lysine exporter family protein LysE/ArgO
MSAFFTGFFLGLSLIVAIGAQNAFVLRQGILRQHIFFIALFCSVADSLLIALGVMGISYFLNNLVTEYSKIIFNFASFWLFSYGIIRFWSALSSKSAIVSNNVKSSNLLSTISIITIITFANPHVYLDTMILIGSISQQFIDLNRVYFAIGACCASFVWFFSLAYGAKLLTPIMQKPLSWRVLDLLIALIMFTIATKLALVGNSL